MESHTPQNGNGRSYGARSYRTRRPSSNGSSSGLSEDKIMMKMEDPVSTGDVPMSEDSSSGIATPSIDVNTSIDADLESREPATSSRLLDPAQLIVKVQLMEHLISNTVATISSLKAAYTQLQSAHVPYDPEKLQIADKAVISELKKLSELKHSYKARLAHLLPTKFQGENEGKHSNPEALQVSKLYQGIVCDMQLEMQKKDAAMDNLKDRLAITNTKKEKLERKVKRLQQKLSQDAVDSSPARATAAPTPQLLESAVLRSSEAVRSFAKLLISLMKTAQWDLDAAANSIEPGMIYIRKTHKKFAFESYISHRMLDGFESGVFNLVVDNVDALSRQDYFKEFQELTSVDPLQVINTKPGSLFAKYCLKKFLDTIHPKMEESFFGNLEQRQQVMSGTHPHTQFYQSFLKLASAMWLLHRLAFSFEPTARMFQIHRDAVVSPLFMESILSMVELDMSSTAVKPRVGFTVMPGFQVGNTIIKCQVYISALSVDDEVKR